MRPARATGKIVRRRPENVSSLSHRKHEEHWDLITIPSDLIAFAVALLGSLCLTVPVRRFALQYGMVDHPGPRKVHLHPVPLLGGIAIYLGFVLAILLTLQGVPQQQTTSILAGATLLAVVGGMDDGRLLHHQVKLFVGMPAAALFLLASGIRADVFAHFIPGIGGVILDGCLTVFWVVGITASFSILDHMDGLCAGIAAVGATFFFLSATLAAKPWSARLALPPSEPHSVSCAGISVQPRFSWATGELCFWAS